MPGSSSYSPVETRFKSLKDRFGWALHADTLALFAFTAGANFLYGKNQMRILAGLLLCGFILTSTSRPRQLSGVLGRIPPEMYAYTAWVAWAGMSGVLVAVDRAAFTADILVVLQMLVLVWLVYAITAARREAFDAVMFGCVSGAIVQVVAVMYGFRINEQLYQGQREIGLTENPNTLGFLMTWATICYLVAWGFSYRKPIWIQLATLGPPAIFLQVLLSTGSRKSLIAITFLIMSWFLFGSRVRSNTLFFVARIGVAAVLITLFVSLGSRYVGETVAGRRMSSTMQDRYSVDKETEERRDLYSAAFKLFLENPVTGIGLSNFNVVSRLYSETHSDFMEALVSTGLVGIVLYESMYYFIIRRAWRRLRKEPNLKVRYQLKMIIVGAVAVQIVGFGAPHYTTPLVYILLVSFSSYTLLGRQP
jgi:O-antigen ligase